MTAPRIEIGTLQSDGTIAWRDITQSIAAACNLAASEVESCVRALYTPTWTAEQCMRALGIRPYRRSTIMGAKIRGAIRRGFRRGR